MPRFDTPEPISVELDLVFADITIVAADRTDTVVELRPGGARENDALAVERTEVTYEQGRLVVRTKQKKNGIFGRRNDPTQDGQVQVTIELPSGSSLKGAAGAGRLHATGRLGECGFRTAAGDIELERTGPLRLDTAFGTVDVGNATGTVEAATAHGTVRFGTIEGRANISNLSGSVDVGTVTGDLRLVGTNGDLSVDRAHSDLDARTVNGNLRVGEIRRGSVALETTAGSIEVGIRRGTSAYLDAQALVGAVHNALSDAAGPSESGETVKVHARTKLGAISVKRSDFS